MPVRCHVPGRLRQADPGPHDVLPVPQAPVRAGRAGEELFYGFCGCARARGWAASWWPARGQDRANASAEASRTEAGLRKLAGRSSPRRAGPSRRRTRSGTCCGADLLLGADTARDRIAVRAGGCRRAAGLQAEREAARPRARAGAGLPGRAGGAPREMAGPRLWWPSPRRRSGWSRPRAEADMPRTGRPAKRPGSAQRAGAGTGKKAAGPCRLQELQAGRREAEAGRTRGRGTPRRTRPWLMQCAAAGYRDKLQERGDEADAGG